MHYRILIFDKNRRFLIVRRLLFTFLFGVAVWSCQKADDPVFDPDHLPFNPATDKIQVEKREMRATWIATVSNLDWPTLKGNGDTQKAELIAVLERCKAMGMNAVILQIRPNADAFYASELEPWSAFLTGTQGVDPGFDPLKVAVEEAHKRGMELHAWLNPYRIGSTSVVLAASHVVLKNPSWMLVYGGVRYFNPGIPEVRDHLVKVVKDIITRYEVDGIHFDDYFYPSGAKSTSNPFGFDDKIAFEKYGAGKDVHTWRADNVNTMVQQVSNAIRSTRSKVVFGISPSGRRENSLDLYADPLVWLNAKWIDYLAPQIYWEIGHPTADFSRLAHYWSDNSSGLPIVIGIAAYKFKDPVYPAFSTVEELDRQLEMTRNLPNLAGAIWYREKYLEGTELNKFIKNKYPYLSLMPAMRPSVSKAPDAPVLTVSGLKMSWNSVSGANKYAVFMLVNDGSGKDTYVARLVALTAETGFSGVSGNNYFVTSVNDEKTESARSEVVYIK